MRTRRTRPTGPEEPLGARERLAWLVVDEETGSVVGRITRVSTSEPGYTDHWQAYAKIEAPYGEPPNPLIRLGPWDRLYHAQWQIEQWHTEREDAERAQALREIREGR